MSKKSEKGAKNLKEDDLQNIEQEYNAKLDAVKNRDGELRELAREQRYKAQELQKIQHLLDDQMEAHKAIYIEKEEIKKELAKSEYNLNDIVLEEIEKKIQEKVKKIDTKITGLQEESGKVQQEFNKFLTQVNKKDTDNQEHLLHTKHVSLMAQINELGVEKHSIINEFEEFKKALAGGQENEFKLVLERISKILEDEVEAIVEIATKRFNTNKAKDALLQDKLKELQDKETEAIATIAKTEKQETQIANAIQKINSQAQSLEEANLKDKEMLIEMRNKQGVKLSSISNQGSDEKIIPDIPNPSPDNSKQIQELQKKIKELTALNTEFENQVVQLQDNYKEEFKKFQENEAKLTTELQSLKDANYLLDNNLKQLAPNQTHIETGNLRLSEVSNNSNKDNDDFRALRDIENQPELDKKEEQLKQAQAANQQLTEELSQIQARHKEELESLEAVTKGLREQIASNQDEQKTFQMQNKKLTKELELLQKNERTLQVENEELRGANQRILKGQKELELANAKLNQGKDDAEAKINTLSGELKNKEAQIVSLSAANQTTQEAQKKLQTENDALQKQNEELRKAQASYKEASEAAQKRENELQEQNEDLNVQLREVNQAAQKKQATLQTVNDGLQRQILVNAVREEQFQKQNDELNEKLKQVQAERDRLNKESEAKINTLSGELKDKEAQIASLSAANQTAQKTQNKLQTENDALQKQNEELAEELRKGQERQEELELANESLKQNNASAEAKINTLSGELKDKKAQINNLSADNQTAQETQKKLQDKNKELERQILVNAVRQEELKKQNDELNEKLKQVQAERDRLNKESEGRINELSDQLKNKNAEITNLNAANQTAQEREKELQAKLGKVQIELQATKHELETAQARYKEASEKVQKVQKESATTAEQLKQVQLQNTGLNEQLNKQNEKLRKAQEAQRNLQTERDELQKQILANAAIQQQLKSKEAQITNLNAANQAAQQNQAKLQQQNEELEKAQARYNSELALVNDTLQKQIATNQTVQEAYKKQLEKELAEIKIRQDQYEIDKNNNKNNKRLIFVDQTKYLHNQNLLNKDTLLSPQQQDQDKQFSGVTKPNRIDNQINNIVNVAGNAHSDNSGQNQPVNNSQDLQGSLSVQNMQNSQPANIAKENWIKKEDQNKKNQTKENENRENQIRKNKNRAVEEALYNQNPEEEGEILKRLRELKEVQHQIKNANKKLANNIVKIVGSNEGDRQNNLPFSESSMSPDELFKKQKEVIKDNKKLMADFERESYKTILEKHSFTAVQWNAKNGTGNTEIIKIPQSNQVVESTIVAQSQSFNFRGQQAEIKRFRNINLSSKIDSSQELTMMFAVKDLNGNNISQDDAVYLTVHYDKYGQLKEMVHPEPVLFTGKAPDSPVCVERNGQLYTLPVNRGKFEELSQAVKHNNLKTVEQKLKESVLLDEVNGIKAKLETNRLKTNINNSPDHSTNQQQPNLVSRKRLQSGIEK